MLTQDRLKELLSYDPETGVFTWLVSRNKGLAGVTAGIINAAGYLCIGVDRKLYRAHRLAWLIHYGYMPDGYIDHASGVKLDNRISNLRLATQSQNLFNKCVSKNSKTGVKGVCFDSFTGRFQVKINMGCKYKHIGRYDTVDEGAAAYAEAASRYHGEFARTS